jgi:hypothetical protein
MGNVLVAILFLAPFLDWIVAFLLLRAAFRFPEVRALRERALLAVAIATGVTVYFFAALNAAWDFPVLGLEDGQVLARISVMTIGLMPLYWLWLYIRKGWDHD